MKIYLLKTALLSALIVIFGASAFAQIKTGGYKAANTDDERVISAAEFAVGKRAETNTGQEGLTLDSIDRAEMQTVAGINYKLCMTVSIDGESQQVVAVVHQNLKQLYSLMSWNPADSCGDEKE